jgi:hypothetical protein
MDTLSVVSNVAMLLTVIGIYFGFRAAGKSPARKPINRWVRVALAFIAIFVSNQYGSDFVVLMIRMLRTSAAVISAHAFSFAYAVTIGIVLSWACGWFMGYVAGHVSAFFHPPAPTNPDKPGLVL